MSDSKLFQQMGRFKLLLASLFVAGVGGAALRLAHAHPDSGRVAVVLQFCLVVLGVFWVRSLGRRLEDAGWPRWCFWPYFLVVFSACAGVHVLKLLGGKEMFGLFLLLVLPTVLLPSKIASDAALAHKPGKPVTPLGAIEFAWYVLLLVGVGYVLHLLWGDVGGIAHSRNIRYAIDICAVLLGVLWGFSLRGRMQAIGRLGWTLGYSLIVLAASLLPLYFMLISFTQMLILFAGLQIPAVILRRRSASAGFSPSEMGS